MLIVADSSALVALATCPALPLLRELFDEFIVPRAVYDEVTVADKPQAKSPPTAQMMVAPAAFNLSQD